MGDYLDKNLRNILYGTFATIIVAFVGAWIQINSRIAVLEVQVRSDHDLFMRNSDRADSDMKVLKDKVTDIQVKVTEIATKQHDMGGAPVNLAYDEH